MSRVGELNTDKSIAATRRDIGDCMRKWRVNAWYLMTGNGRAVLTYTVRDRHQEIACDRFPSAEQNARALYGLVDALRLADQRGMLREMAEQAAALLSAPVRARPAHEVLRVFPDAPLAVIEAAYRALAKTAHPDAGGTDEAMKELNEAYETMRKERES